MKYNLKFIKEEYNSDLLVSEYVRMAKVCGITQSERNL